MKSSLILATSILCLSLSNSALAACSAEHSSAAKQSVSVNKINQAVLADAILAETNAHRCKNKRKSLILDSGLLKAANSHSGNMAKLNKLSHTLPVKGQKTMSDRFKKNKIALRGVGAENISTLFKIDVANGPFGIKNASKCQFTDASTKKILPEYTYERLAKRVVKNWSNSKSHNKNLLLKKAGRMGAAATFTSGDTLCGTYYITQTFAGK